MKETLVQLLPSLLSLLALVLSALVFPALKKWLEAKASASAAAAIALKVEHFAEVTVADLGATLRPTLEAASADGTLSADDVAKLRDAALARMKALLGTEGLSLVQGALGIGADAVSGYLQGAVEKSVAKAPAAGPQ